METAHFGEPLHNNNSEIFQPPFDTKYFRYDVKDAILEKLVCFVISLREIAKYDGDVVIFFYKGPIPRLIYKFLKKFDIKLEYVDRNFSISQNYTPVTYYRHIDALKYIQNKNYDYITLYDLDVWFDRDINDIYNDETIPTDGCLHSGNWLGPSWIGHPKDIIEAQEFYKKLEIMNQKFFTKAVMGYYFSANKDMFIKRMNEYKKQVEMGLVPIAWGADQFLLNYLFDIEKDLIDQSLVFIDDSYFWKEDNNIYYTEVFPPYDKTGFKRAYAYHCGRLKSWGKTEQTSFDFKKKYADIYKKYWDINYPFANQH